MGRLEILCTRFRHTRFRSTASSLVRTIIASSSSSSSPSSSSSARDTFSRDCVTARKYVYIRRIQSRAKRGRNAFENFPVPPNKDVPFLFVTPSFYRALPVSLTFLFHTFASPTPCVHIHFAFFLPLPPPPRP